MVRQGSGCGPAAQTVHDPFLIGEARWDGTRLWKTSLRSGPDIDRPLCERRWGLGRGYGGTGRAVGRATLGDELQVFVQAADTQ